MRTCSYYATTSAISPLPQSGIIICLDFLVYSGPEELGQLSQTGLHCLVVPLGDIGAPPPEVVHLVGPVFAPLLVQLRGRPGAGPSSRTSLLLPVAAPLPAGLRRGKELGGVASLLRGGENLDGPAFAARRFAPAEVLHRVRAPLVVVGRVPVLGAQDGQKNAK